jgi:6-phosphogluconolactonase/glucosamine-6-phosphate isomerase/deaminase
MDRQALLGLNHYKEKSGIIIFESASVIKANEVTTEILQKYSDFKTALFLSGGSTPKKLYEHLAKEKTVKAGSVAQIDERFGKRGHRHSNEVMIENSGLIKYFESQNIRFYPMLEHVITRYNDMEELAKDYDEALRFILKYFPKSVGILGIGADGHTAGVPAGNSKSQKSNPKPSEIVRKMIEDKSSLVSYYELEGYGPRITLNFQGLSMLDLIIVLVLGKEKRDALKRMFKDPTNPSGGAAEVEYPARFYLKPEIAKKTILITDQVVS